MILKFKKINFKKILSAIGLLAITSASTLSVIGCNSFQHEITNPEKLVVDAINKVEDYSVTVSVNSNVHFVKEKINDDFIKNSLSKEIQKIFSWKLFHLIEIYNHENEPLNNDDLIMLRVINAKIYYSYGEINNKIVSLIINVRENK